MYTVQTAIFLFFFFLFFFSLSAVEGVKKKKKKMKVYLGIVFFGGLGGFLSFSPYLLVYGGEMK